MINWVVLLKERQRMQSVVLAVLFAFCALGFWNDWSFDPYRYEAARRIEGLACVKAYYEENGDGRCPTIYPVDSVHIPLSTWLDGAKAVNASFYKNIREEIQREDEQRRGR
jgi:hypothetical protein